MLKKVMGKSFTFAISLMTILFTFVPESMFEKCVLFETQYREVNIIINRIICLITLFVFICICYYLYMRLRDKVTIKGKNYIIQIEYGDIFGLNNCKRVIPFDECFTTIVGAAPSEIKANSICGQYLNSNPIDNMAELIQNAQLRCKQKPSRFKNSICYRSGTLLARGNDLLMAFAYLDEDGVARMTRDEYLDSLSVLWREIEKYYGQSDVCIPILGSGLTRINGYDITQQELLDIIIMSYKLSSYKIKSPYKLRIICKRNDDFSLNEINER